MVSSGTVSNDLGILRTSFSSYQSSISDLSSVWKGDSYNNLVTQSEQFVSEYKSAIEKQMNAFASACASYAEYVQTKSALASARAAYAQAEAEKNTGLMSSYSAQIAELSSKLERLKAEIEASLAEASSPAFAAPTTASYNGITATSLAASSPVAVQKAIDTALGLAADDTHGYSQKTRWGNPNYDCSSFVITCWDSAGTGVKDAGATYTGNMKRAFLSTGLFEWIPGTLKAEDLQPGDVLLNQKVHTEMYIGDGKMVGAHGDFDGSNGDGNGRELSVCKYSGSWEGVLRYIGPSTTATTVSL